MDKNIKFFLSVYIDFYLIFLVKLSKQYFRRHKINIACCSFYSNDLRFNGKRCASNFKVNTNYN